MPRVHILRSMPSRLRGLLGCPPSADLVMLVPCKDIHTLGMKYPLDIAFIGRDGFVLDAYRHVEPRCRLRCAQAAAVVERAAHPSAPWFKPGAFAGKTIRNALRERK